MMSKESSEIDWSQLPKPLPANLFDKYTHQSILPPLTSLNIDETLWNECRSYALNLGQKGFLDPLAILYTSFKRYYPNCPSIRSFTRWLILYEKNTDDFKNYFKEYSIHTLNIQSAGELKNLIKNLSIDENLNILNKNYDQIWFLFAISIRIPITDPNIQGDTLILNEGATRLSVKHKKTQTSTRIHCLVALTPSGKFSNQLIICKQNRQLKMNWTSSIFTRIIETSTGDINYEHIQQWFEDFIQLSYGKNHSAILIDPRTTILIPELEDLCEKSNIDLLTVDLNYYLINILCPIFSLFDKQCSEMNRINQMYLKPANELKRILFTLWFSLRTLKQNEQICQLFQQTCLWKKDDDLYRESLRLPITTTLPKKKKKKSPVKTGTKVKLSTTTSSSTMMTDPPNESTPEQILSYVIQRQLSISRASKSLGGIKLDYLKYCLSYKSNASLMTGKRLIELNNFMQSQSTVDWLRYLRSLYFWPCAKQLFLREIYHLTGIITRKRTMNNCGNGNIGSIRTCDLQSPGIFWRAFEDIHQIEFDNESIIDDQQWHDDFQQYFIDNKLNDKTPIWTVDTFEFPLTKKSTVLQLPEWNELRPMNLTPKVTVIYAFSNTGQSIEPCFIFPTTFYDKTMNNNDKDFSNELGHLTSDIFYLWIEKYLSKQSESPLVLILCSRLPVLSIRVLELLTNSNIYPYGYPYTRTIPFRYLFERRVRNNRPTNFLSDLWKKKLLDEQRTHVLKGTNCTIDNIKHHFEQIWLQIMNDKEVNNDDDHQEYKTFELKCQQAFKQANIEIKINNNKKKSLIKLTPKKSLTKKLNEQDIVNELNNIIDIVGYLKEHVTSTNGSQILKMNNHIQEMIDSQLSPSPNELINNTENASTTSSDSTPSSSTDKRSIDENDKPPISKRLRSSCTQSNNSNNSSTNIQWIPPSKEIITNLQSQSSSLFQFTLALIRTIYSSTDLHLTDEHIRWLHSTLNLYTHNNNNNYEKLNTLIETACLVIKFNLIR